MLHTLQCKFSAHGLLVHDVQFSFLYIFYQHWMSFSRICSTSASLFQSFIPAGKKIIALLCSHSSCKNKFIFHLTEGNLFDMYILHSSENSWVKYNMSGFHSKASIRDLLILVRSVLYCVNNPFVFQCLILLIHFFMQTINKMCLFPNHICDIFFWPVNKMCCYCNYRQGQICWTWPLDSKWN